MKNIIAIPHFNLTSLVKESLEPISTIQGAFQVGSGFIALFALLVAVKSYLHSSRTSRLSHMHKLFSDYLKMRVDIALKAGVGDEDDTRKAIAFENTTFISAKLYTLEEMYLWLENEYPQLSKGNIVYAWLRDLFGGNRITSYEGWRSTIRFHLRHEAAATERVLMMYSTAFSKPFWKFCRQEFPDLPHRQQST